MRILFVSNIFPSPSLPTKGTYNRELVRALTAAGHDVRVIAPIAWTEEWRARRAGRSVPAGGRSTLAGAEVHYPRYYFTPKLFRGQYGRFMWHSVKEPMRGLVRDFRPEAVLGYWAHPDGEVAVRAARAAGAPAAVMVGGSDVFLLARHPGRRAKIMNVLRDADAVIAVSRDLKHKLVSYGLDPAKVYVVPRGVDLDAFSPGDRGEARRRVGVDPAAPALVWVGQMVSVKRLDVLLEACAKLRRANTDVRLYLIGDGPLRPQLEAQCAALGLSGAVTFVGPLGHDSLPDWYRAADLTVLPSRSEGVPNVLRESLACGTPFVASRVGGIHELGEDRPNRLVLPDDPIALAAAISDCLRDAGSGVPLPRMISWRESAGQVTSVLGQLIAEQCTSRSVRAPGATAVGTTID